MQQEEEKRINNDLNQYDTTLFNKDSKEVNDAIAKQKKERQQQINERFKSSESLTRLTKLKKVLFSKSNLNKDFGELIKARDSKQAGEKNIP